MKLKPSFSYSLIFLALIFFTACSKKDPEPTIEGLWTVQSLEMDVVTRDLDTQEVYSSVPCNYDASSPNQSIDADSRLMINSDGTGSLIFSGECVETFEFDFEWTYELDREFRIKRSNGFTSIWYVTQLTHDRVLLYFIRENWNRNVTPRLVTRRGYYLEFRRQ